MSIAYTLGLHEIDDGLILKVIIIASSMPMGILALVATSIYDLDLDLANSCWLITTAGLVVVIPALFFILEML